MGLISTGAKLMERFAQQLLAGYSAEVRKRAGIAI
jgi:hypothetical protein